MKLKNIKNIKGIIFSSLGTWILIAIIFVLAFILLTQALMSQMPT